MGMTSCSGATSTMRLPVVGNWSVQSPRGGVSLVRWTTLTMRMPLAGAVPAVAAFSATETALNEPFAGVIAAVIPGAIGAAAVWTRYSDACGNPCVCQAMSASSSLKPSSGAKPVTKFPLTFPSAKYAQIKLPPFASLSAGVKTPLVRWGAIDPAALLVPLTAATVAMPVNSETVYWKFLTGASKVMVIVSTQAPPAQAFGSTKIDEINWLPSSAVTTGGPQVCTLTSVTETVRVFDHSYEIPITRQLPGSTGFGSVNLKALPNSLMLTGLAELETCWTSAGAAGPEGGGRRGPFERDGIAVRVDRGRRQRDLVSQGDRGGRRRHRGDHRRMIGSGLRTGDVESSDYDRRRLLLDHGDPGGARSDQSGAREDARGDGLVACGQAQRSGERAARIARQVGRNARGRRGHRDAADVGARGQGRHQHADGHFGRRRLPGAGAEQERDAGPTH